MKTITIVSDKPEVLEAIHTLAIEFEINVELRTVSSVEEAKEVAESYARKSQN